MLMKKRPLFVALSVVIFTVVAAAGVVYYMYRNKSLPSGVPKGYVRVIEYQYYEPDAAVCQAISPECGVCLGIVVDKNCYVEKNK